MNKKLHRTLGEIPHLYWKCHGILFKTTSSAGRHFTLQLHQKGGTWMMEVLSATMLHFWLRVWGQECYTELPTLLCVAPGWSLETPHPIWTELVSPHCTDSRWLRLPLEGKQDEFETLGLNKWLIHLFLKSAFQLVRSSTMQTDSQELRWTCVHVWKAGLIIPLGSVSSVLQTAGRKKMHSSNLLTLMGMYWGREI